MEPIESSETSAYNNTLTPGTYPNEKKLQSKHGESLKSRKRMMMITTTTTVFECENRKIPPTGQGSLYRVSLSIHNMLPPQN